MTGDELFRLAAVERAVREQTKEVGEVKEILGRLDERITTLFANAERERESALRYRAAQERDCDRCREDLQERIHAGDDPAPTRGATGATGPTGPIWPTEFRTRVWLTIAAGVVGFLAVVGWADDLANGFLAFLRDLLTAPR